MIVSIDDIAKNSLTYENETFENTVVLFDTGGRTGILAKPPREIRFHLCVFKEGVQFSYNERFAGLEQLDFFFENCHIGQIDASEKNIIRANDAERPITINFYNCLMFGMVINAPYLKSVTFVSCLSLEKGVHIHKSEIVWTSFYDCIGLYLVTGGHSQNNCAIHYGDRVDLMTNEFTREFINVYLKNSNLNSLPEIPTEFKFIDPSKLTASSGPIVSKKQAYLHPYNENSGRKFPDIAILVANDTGFKSTVEISRMKLRKLELINATSGNYRIDELKCDNFVIHGALNSQFEIHGLIAESKQSTFEIRNSTMSSSWLDRCDLSSFGIVNIHRSTLVGLKLTQVKFPEKIKARRDIKSSDGNNINHDDEFENYRQLKQIYLRDDNRPFALKMHMKMYGALRRSPNLDWESRKILWLNGVSNEHGTSIIRPFLLAIGIVVICFTLYILGTPMIYHTPMVPDVGGHITSQLKVLFILANPAHKLSSLAEATSQGNLNLWHHGISFFSRIVMAWIYYQFISSFRRYGKNMIS